MKLSALSSLYLKPLQQLLEDSDGFEYVAVHVLPDQQAVKQLPANEQVAAFRHFHRAYALSILERCHLAAITSAARLHKWLTATLVMADAGNVLGFSASLRGYLEAAADAHDALSHVPRSLLRAGSYLYAVLHRPELLQSTAMSFADLEDKLIHYEFAARAPKTGPQLPHHKAQDTTLYIRNYETSAGIAGVGALYAHLCDVTHPARGSVEAFLKYDPPRTVLSLKASSQVISGILTQYESTIQDMVSVSLNAAIVTISMLHQLTDCPTADEDWVASNPALEDLLNPLRNAIQAAKAPGATEADIRATLC